MGPIATAVTLSTICEENNYRHRVPGPFREPIRGEAMEAYKLRWAVRDRELFRAPRFGTQILMSADGVEAFISAGASQCRKVEYA